MWRGVTYDFFQFTQLQLAVAAVLGIEAGYYFHHATSLHIYESDFDAADKCRTSKIERPFQQKAFVHVPKGFLNPADAWGALQADVVNDRAIYMDALG
jgi:thymidylate synthase